MNLRTRDYTDSHKVEIIEEHSYREFTGDFKLDDEMRTAEQGQRGARSSSLPLDVVPLSRGVFAASDALLAIEPFIFDQEAFVLYGEPGSMKSYVALAIALVAALGQAVDGIPFIPTRQYRPLFLDWETHDREQYRRLTQIGDGFGLQIDNLINYRQCHTTLAADVQAVEGAMSRGGFDFLVVDSLGLAAGGDLMASQSAEGFFRALRKLSVTSLIVAHPAKGQTRNSSIYGSQFFTAQPRGIAEISKKQVPGAPSGTVTIHHTKSNLSALVSDITLPFEFGDEGLRFCSGTGVASGPQTHCGVKGQILDFMQSEGREFLPAQLERLLDRPGGSVRSALKRLKEEGAVIYDPENGKYQAHADAPF
ncbi:AAA family ATPase [Candidatus Bipolaricaulota bacterium]